MTTMMVRAAACRDLTGHWAKCLTASPYSLTGKENGDKKHFLDTLYGWEYWDSERLSHLPKSQSRRQILASRAFVLSCFLDHCNTESASVLSPFMALFLPALFPFLPPVFSFLLPVLFFLSLCLLFFYSLFSPITVKVPLQTWIHFLSFPPSNV